MTQDIHSVVAKRKINPRREIPNMILMKNDSHPSFGFWSIYGTGSYILFATEEGK